MAKAETIKRLYLDGIINGYEAIGRWLILVSKDQSEADIANKYIIDMTARLTERALLLT